MLLEKKINQCNLTTLFFANMQILMKLMKGAGFCTAMLLLLTLTKTTFAQIGLPDGEGTTQAAQLKKIDKKANYGAALIEQEINFETGKGLDNMPIVTAKEKGKIEMVSIEKNALIGYVLPYNTFAKLADYDFEIFGKKDFKSQKYPPERISLTDESIYLDDNFGEFYGFKATEMGVRCRFSYLYKFTDAKYLTRIFFHGSYPTKQYVINIKVPSWLELDILEKNFEGYKIKVAKKTDKAITTYTYTAENLNTVKNEPNSLARPYYLPHLILTVRGYTIDQKKYNGFRTVDDLYSWYNFLYKKADNKIAELKTQVNTLTAVKATDEDKVKAIYYWVQDNIRYIAFEEGYAGFVPQTVQEVYKNKYGDCKGMANLLTEMLKMAGLDAHFAWIGTRDIPYSHNEVQSMCVDNHAISVLYMKGKTYFIDGTEKYAPLGVNAYRIQGKTVLVEHGNTSKVETVPMSKLEDNLMFTKANLKLNNDLITGHVTISFTGEAKNFFHYVYNNIPANKRQDFVKSLIELGDDNVEATNIKSSDFKNRDVDILVEGDVDISNQITTVARQSYLGVDFIPRTLEQFIPKEDRTTPLDLNHIFYSKDEVTLTLPKGAKVSSMPPAYKSAFKENAFDATYTATATTLQLKKTMALNTPFIYANDFTAWKDFINQIKDFNRKKIILTMP